MKNNIILIIILALCVSSCDESLLNLKSLTEPVDATFFSNEEELNLALTGVYNTLQFTPLRNIPIGVNMDNSATDIGISRGYETHGFGQLGTGSHSSTSNIYRLCYSHFYTAIARANTLLENMEKSKEIVDSKKYAQIQAQALVIRAYNYMYLTELFGDVPLMLKTIYDPNEALVPRTAKSIVVDSILQNLDAAVAVLPEKWESNETERITKGAALALKARIALYNKKYDEAASAAKAVIDNEEAMGYQLHPDYGELFDLQGEGSSEVILVMPFVDGFKTSFLPREQGSRNLGSWSTLLPTQTMIDSYEANDGKPIDESAVYDPKHPFANRDPRLNASIILPGTVWAGQMFESHPDSSILRGENGENLGSNKNCRSENWPAAYCGYLWKKYTVEKNQEAFQGWSDQDFILIRLAEVLLTYAEAKTEAGEIDESVLDAINRVRARAYGVDVSNTDAYPAITTTNQAELRKVIRRERKVEFANEGLRLFDIRRWRIAEKVMPVTIYGQILDKANASGVPQIDDDNHVSYQGIENQYDLNNNGSRFPNTQGRIFNPSRDYLCPIPQQEIDTYAGLGGSLEQNPGY